MQKINWGWESVQDRLLTWPGDVAGVSAALLQPHTTNLNSLRQQEQNHPCTRICCTTGRSWWSPQHRELPSHRLCRTAADMSSGRAKLLQEPEGWPKKALGHTAALGHRGTCSSRCLTDCSIPERSHPQNKAATTAAPLTPPGLQPHAGRVGALGCHMGD